MIGPGKYDDLATQAMEASHATAVVVIVFGGDKGSGFSVQTADLNLLTKMPQILRNMADDIDRDLKKTEAK